VTSLYMFSNKNNWSWF